jgi:hypothetical protein
MSQSENTPPAFFKAPAVTAPSEVFKALLVYQRAQAIFQTTDAAFKRTKAGYLRKDDYPAHDEAQRAFYRDAHAAWKTIHDWADEVTLAHSSAYFKSLWATFIAAGIADPVVSQTAVFKAIKAHPDVDGDVSRMFAMPCTPDWFDAFYGSRKFRIAIRLENPYVNSIDFYGVREDNRVSGFNDISARLHYRGYQDEHHKPVVRVSSEEGDPAALADYAAAIKDAGILATFIADFNNREVPMKYDLHRHRGDLIEQVLTVRPGSIDEPVNPDAK